MWWDFLTEGVGLAEAMIFAIENINNDLKLLRNISLGYDIRDCCERVTRATRVTYELLKDKCRTNSTQYRMGEKPITALIGPVYSRTALVIGGFLEMLNVSGISGTTTSPELSSHTYAHMHRTVPQDTFLAKAMADIIDHFNWSYIAAIGVDDSYGRNGVWSVIEEAENRNGSFCVALTEFIPHHSQTSNIKDTVTKLRRHENIRVIILWMYGAILRNFLKEVRRQNLSGRFWVLSEISFTLDLPSVFSSLHGSIAIQPHNFDDAGFKEYLKALLSNESNKQDRPEWWNEILALQNNCSASKDNTTEYEKSCSHNVVNDMYSPYVPYYIDAVYSVAHALDIFTRYANTTDSSDCQQSFNMATYDMQKLLSRVNFTGLTGQILFDEFGDRRTAVYDIINFQQVQEADAKRLKLVIVGNWDVDERLQFYENMHWNNQTGSSLKSECLDQCSAGTRKSTTSPCCWQCVPCPRGTINPIPGSESCIECPRGKRSNEAQTECVVLPLANLKYSSAGGIVIIAFGTCGIIAALLSFAVICRFWNTPIVKASNRELSLVILVIITLLLSLPFINLFEPTDTICKIIYPWRYITYNLCLSFLLVKVLRISSAFQVPILPGLTICSAVTHRIQAGVIVIILQVLLLLLLLPWLILDPPSNMEHIYPDRYKFNECKAYNMLGGKILFLLTCSYVFLQMLMSAFCSFKIRNIPENFSEAKRIAFSMYIFLFSFLAHHPVEFSMDGWYVSVVDCVTTLLSAYGFLCCIFLPKLYILLFRPELNTLRNIKQEVTQFSFRSTAIHVNPAFENSTEQCRT
ncbi:hypothetical protein OS493_035747 [Desmophyllum pertusum]|uniref:G-protein coupled receptors family 3 profile domain-containing protein n=1 Tax=Desmophyllum pertusum TaxID=174260 RepID=A0A9W9ZZC8_9CNID|nr:hypothetical protein OS493_035747 [Desmophyllum pertusum]